MHLLVLSAFRHIAERVVCHVPSGFNAPSGAQCFPTYKQGNYRRCEARVSMHLLVLSAFRPEEGAFVHLDIPVSMHLLVLSAFQLAPLGWMSVGLRSFNAPSGAQCFPTDGDDGASQESAVSMHLLVLSAFQRHKQVRGHLHRLVSMHLLVLSAFQLRIWILKALRVLVSMHLLVLSAFQPASLRAGRTR